ncbi:hypothetical protein [Trichlorobacter lovleyi]|uniref:hypothetical protein n=1 Tax=Trichlorobacter lovleyi TaxID=313985 RepID=UPI003D0AF824
MPQIDTMKELDFLIQETGKDSGNILAMAVQEGVHLLFKRQVAEAYINNRIDREKAVLLLGDEQLADLDYAWKAVESDIKWGMGNA